MEVTLENDQCLTVSSSFEIATSEKDTLQRGGGGGGQGVPAPNLSIQNYLRYNIYTEDCRLVVRLQMQGIVVIGQWMNRTVCLDE